MIFELVKDFADVLTAMPPEHQRRRILALIDEAICRDVHFVQRGPTTLFQSLWNLCWWHDGPHTSLVPPHSDAQLPETECATQTALPTLHRLIETWQRQKESADLMPSVAYSLRPPRLPLESGLVGVLAGHMQQVSDLAFSPDGRTLATVSPDGDVRVWDVAEQTLLARFSSPGTALHAVAFSPDGVQFASGGDDHCVRIWSLLTHSVIHELHGHEGPVLGLTYSGDGARLASCSADRTIRVWDAHSSTEQLHIPVSKDLGGPSNFVGMTTTLGGPPRIMREDLFHRIAFSPDDTLIASGSGMRFDALCLWDARTGQLKDRFVDRGMMDLSGISFAPNGKLIATGSDRLRIWNVDNGTMLEEASPSNDGITQVCFANDGASLYTLSHGGNLELRVVGQDSVKVIAEDVRCHKMVWSGNSGLLALAVDSKAVWLWDPAKSHRVKNRHDHLDHIISMSLSVDASRLATGGLDSTVRIWKTETGTEQLSVDTRGSSPHSIAISPDGSMIAISIGMFARLFDLDTGNMTHALGSHPGDVQSVAFSHDGRRLAVGSRGERGLMDFAGDVRVWDLASGRRVAIFRRHGHGATAVAMSPNGQFVAAGSEDGFIAVWDVERGNQYIPGKEDESEWIYSQGSATWLNRWRGPHRSPIIELAFSPDGCQLVAVSSECTSAWAWESGAPTYVHPERTDLYAIAELGTERLGIAICYPRETLVTAFFSDEWAVAVPGPVFHVRLSRDGTFIACSQGGNLEMYRLDMPDGVKKLVRDCAAAAAADRRRFVESVRHLDPDELAELYGAGAIRPASPVAASTMHSSASHEEPPGSQQERPATHEEQPADTTEMVLSEHMRELGRAVAPVIWLWPLIAGCAAWFLSADVADKLAASSGLALILVYPLFAWRLWGFVGPGLLTREHMYCWLAAILCAGTAVVVAIGTGALEQNLVSGKWSLNATHLGQWLAKGFVCAVAGATLYGIRLARAELAPQSKRVLLWWGGAILLCALITPSRYPGYLVTVGCVLAPLFYTFLFHIMRHRGSETSPAKI